MEEIIDGYAEWQNRPDLTGIGRMPERAAFFSLCGQTGGAF